ncbi:MAG: PdaC/SigV domain-containing protein [Butyrivibrio sp.]
MDAIFKQYCLKWRKIKIFTAGVLVSAAMLLASCGTTKSTGQTEAPDLSKADVQTEVSGQTKPESPKETEEASTSAAAKPNEVRTLGAQTGYFCDYYWDDATERTAAYMKYPYMHLGEADREIYPELEQSLTDLMNERKKQALRLYEDAVQAAKEISVENPDNHTFYEVTETVNVRRADSRVLSLLFYGSTYTGGVHGQPYAMGAVFDTETGRRLSLGDVVTDIKLIPDLVQKELETFWDTDYLYGDLDLHEYFDENIENIEWVLDYQGLSIYFNPYDIAPYASGMQNVTISFAEHSEIFKEKYLQVPESYGVEIAEEKPFFFDADGDGKTDSLTISAAKGAYENYEVQQVTLNGETFSEDTGIYIIEPVLMHTADGRNYLYIVQQYPDDIWVTEVFDLSDKTVRKVDTVYSGRHCIEEQGDFTRQVLTNPVGFMLDTYTQMLGTAWGCDSYHTGADGLPVQEHEWYTICHNTEMTLLKDLTVQVVDEAGNAMEKTELKAGDKVSYYRTDGISWADIRLTDGRLVRVNPVHGEKGWTVNGVNPEELFDGVAFGG